ncbi:MAG TPA: right-handed parallel beta-helix repeat-containing protein [Burkholderiaceae bacterium]|nr:right-handed parallel beta-helix repeat-containing protein [Burkholderiaceae bacterium]
MKRGFVVPIVLVLTLGAGAPAAPETGVPAARESKRESLESQRESVRVPSKSDRGEGNTASSAESRSYGPPVVGSKDGGKDARADPRVVSVAAFGARGDGVTDDSRALRAALDGAPKNGIVRFERGHTYLVHGKLLVKQPGVKLVGYGATIQFHVTEDELRGPKGAAQISIQLLAPSTGVYGLTVTSNLDRRLTGHQDLGGIVLASENNEVIDNHLRYTHVGIFARYARNFVIARNTVERTFADGIHVTTGSWGGLITGNTVRETGDDMIAVVNYGAGEPNVGNVVIENNDVAGQYWGRGITVVGGRDVTIRRNRIADTTHAAAIFIAAERHYNTANVANVLVEGNEIANVQTSDAVYNPIRTRKKTGHAAIQVLAEGDKEIRDVLIRGNRIVNSPRGGISVRGAACRIGIEENKLERIGTTPIQMDQADRSDSCAPACRGNRSGRLAADPGDCRDRLLGVSGASFQATAREVLR